MVISNAHMKTARDLIVLARFIEVYCEGRHGSGPPARRPEVLPVEELLGAVPVLCDDCNKLLAHSFFKRLHCPMDPRPPASTARPLLPSPLPRTDPQGDALLGWALIKRGRIGLLWKMFF